MKNYLFAILGIAILLFSACEKGELYSFNRPHYSTSYKTRSQYELQTAAYKDTLFEENGEGVINAYFTIIQSEFAHVLDTIVQYGHCWSTKGSNPTIDIDDTTTFSRFYNWPNDSLGTFTSRINLYPETIFWVRSYVITSQGDTGYNQQVYCDTTLPPINEWFQTQDVANFQGNGREGAFAFTMVSPIEKKLVGYMGTGNDASQTFGAIYTFDGETETWSQLPGILPIARTEAVAFGLAKTDQYGNKTTNIYVGGGVDMAGNILKDFYKYSFVSMSWTRIDDFPRGIKSGVAFTIGDKAYVGLGVSNSDKGSFYMFDYKLAENFQDPWIPIPGLGNEDVIYARRDAVAFVIDGVAFVGTGMHVTDSNDTIYYNDLWKFMPDEDVANNSRWGKCEAMPSSGRTQAVGLAIDNQGYIGLGTDGTSYLKDFYRYDPYINKWYIIANYKIGPNFSGQLQRTVNAFGFGIKKKGYVGSGFLGEEHDNPYSQEMWIYRPW